jgi:hypothetical protein
VQQGELVMTSEKKLDYLGFVITWLQTRLPNGSWRVMLTSDDPHLLTKLGGRAKEFMDSHSLEGAIRKAQQDVDELWEAVS